MVSRLPAEAAIIAVSHGAGESGEAGLDPQGGVHHRLSVETVGNQLQPGARPGPKYEPKQSRHRGEKFRRRMPGRSVPARKKPFWDIGKPESCVRASTFQDTGIRIWIPIWRCRFWKRAKKSWKAASWCRFDGWWRRRFPPSRWLTWWRRPSPGSAFPARCREMR